jgi:tetrahydrodipicolinate N-succinyltransferase
MTTSHVNHLPPKIILFRLHDQLAAEGLKAVTVVHPGAQIASNASIGEGCQLMAGSIVNPEARLGRQCIINTKASVDHEYILNDGVEAVYSSVPSSYAKCCFACCFVC